MTKNFIDLSAFKPGAGNYPIAYRQDTYLGSGNDMFNIIEGTDKWLIGGAEYNHERFTQVFENTVVCNKCITNYYHYFSNQAGDYSKLIISPFAPTPDGARTVTEADAGTGIGTGGTVAAASGAAALSYIAYVSAFGR